MHLFFCSLFFFFVFFRFILNMHFLYLCIIYCLRFYGSMICVYYYSVDTWNDTHVLLYSSLCWYQYSEWNLPRSCENINDIIKKNRCCFTFYRKKIGESFLVHVERYYGFINFIFVLKGRSHNATNMGSVIKIWSVLWQTFVCYKIHGRYLFQNALWRKSQVVS